MKLSDSFLVIKKPENTQSFELDLESEKWFISKRDTNSVTLSFITELRKQNPFGADIQPDQLMDKMIPHEDCLELIPFFIFTKTLNGRKYYLTHYYEPFVSKGVSQIFNYNHVFSNPTFSKHMVNKSIVFADHISNYGIDKNAVENLSDNIYDRLKDLIILSSEYTVEDLVKDISMVIKPTDGYNNISDSLLGLGFIVDVTEHALNPNSKVFTESKVVWEELLTIKTEVIFDKMILNSHRPTVAQFTYDKWSRDILSSDTRSLNE